LTLDKERGSHENLETLLGGLQTQVFRFHYDLGVKGKLLFLVTPYTQMRVLCVDQLWLKPMEEETEGSHFLREYTLGKFYEVFTLEIGSHISNQEDVLEMNQSFEGFEICLNQLYGLGLKQMESIIGLRICMS
jgi:hypothetical protein